ncbi:G-protein coupled receptor [Biomphalaria pfeifferi]|uniref:G-protein coupled receptor n=1 Tax=Biomphalaria pfeifferi TaxID=112525 RepID=A0AAD8BKL2_BIOPF|nr:G-protein coupled receptor [Biomphalaria pfeifferi]
MEERVVFNHTVTSEDADSDNSTILDGQHGLLSYSARDVFIIVNHVIISSTIGLFGIVANVINMCVFRLQGWKSSTNISFFALTLCDLFSLIFLEWMNICLNPFIETIDSVIIFKEIQFLTAGILHVCTARITSCVTAYITAERCLSIVFPLKIKQLVTPRRAATIMVIIYSVNIATLIPEYAAAYFDWKFYPPKNKTMIGLQFRSYKTLAESLLFIFHAALAVFSFVATIVFTSILVLKLKLSAQFRKSTTFDSEQIEMKTTRDKRTMTMVILVATNLIIFYFPTVAFCIVLPVVPEFSIIGRESNLFEAVWSFAFLCHSINSSINIFVYLKMSSKFKNNFWKLFSVSANDKPAELVRKTNKETQKL